MNVKLPNLEGVPRLDSLLVLGRGIDIDGRLSETSMERAETAAYLAAMLVPNVVVFSGGRSWRQVLEGIEPPSEGGAMLERAREVLDVNEPDGVKLLAEEESTSTVANMVNSKPLLELDSDRSTLGILSDDLHFRFGRPQRLAKLVFPDIKVVTLGIPSEITSQAIREERLSAIFSRLIMTGVTPGNDSAIMRRHRALEKLNDSPRRLGKFLHNGVIGIFDDEPAV